jgi:hypothetical protein
MKSLRLRVGAAMIAASVLILLRVAPTTRRNVRRRRCGNQGRREETAVGRPHVWLQITVDEKMQEGMECRRRRLAPSHAYGWRSTSFKPGDAVTVRINPMKDGTAAGSFIGAVRGRRIGRW